MKLKEKNKAGLGRLEVTLQEPRAIWALQYIAPVPWDVGQPYNVQMNGTTVPPPGHTAIHTWPTAGCTCTCATVARPQLYLY